jgi:hypothetical protein
MEISEAQIEQARSLVTDLKTFELYILNNGRALIDPLWLYSVCTCKYHKTAVPITHSVKVAIHDHPCLLLLYIGDMPPLNNV